MITLQFVSELGLGGLFIQWYGHSAYSHVDCVMPDGHLLGARIIGGVQIRPKTYGTFTRFLRVNIPASPTTTDAYLAALKAEVGKPYDATAILGFVTGRNWREPDSWFCSELLAAMLEKVKVFPYPLSSPANRITPQDLIIALSAIVLVPAH